MRSAKPRIQKTDSRKMTLKRINPIHAFSFVAAMLAASAPARAATDTLSSAADGISAAIRDGDTPITGDDGKMIGMARPWEMGLQAAASPMKERMEWFHNSLLLPVAVGIVIFVMILLFWVMVRYNEKANPQPSKTTHNTLLEVVWTLVPVIILVVIVIPSMRMLYYVDRTQDADMTLNITGYQWYWGYEYPDNGGINFMSNLVPEKDIKPGQQVLLSTDNPVVLPIDTNIRLIMTGADVIHSWAMPSMGVKLDAVPGRHNETWVRIDREGTFYGQCSEICGQGHGFMPIEIHAVSKADFATWVHKQGGKMPEEIAAEKAAKDAADKAAADKAAAEAKEKADKAAKDKAGAKPADKKDGDKKETDKKEAGKKEPAKKGE